jgi:hypothetical protein
MPATQWDVGLMGVQACRICHETEYQDWAATPHARAFEVLGPAQQADPKCMGCHSTGDRPHLAGVQCESCHGPGLHYWPGFVMRDLFLARALGLRKAGDPSVCGRCHTKDAPSIQGFDLPRDLQRVNHSNVPGQS